MHSPPLSTPRLYALLGESMHQLPLPFVQKLEVLLHGYEMERRSASGLTRDGLAPVDLGTEVSATPREATVPLTGRVSMAQRRLQGAAAVLEVLHAAHLDQWEEGPGAMFGEHLVEGLVVAGRHLVDAAREALDGSYRCDQAQ